MACRDGGDHRRETGMLSMCVSCTHPSTSTHTSYFFSSIIFLQRYCHIILPGRLFFLSFCFKLYFPFYERSQTDDDELMETNKK